MTCTFRKRLVLVLIAGTVRDFLNKWQFPANSRLCRVMVPFLVPTPRTRSNLINRYPCVEASVHVYQVMVCITIAKMFRLELDLDLLNQYAVIVLAIVALLFICFDVNYFVRLITTLVYGMYFQKPLNVFDTCTIYGICTTNDLDFVLKHMNNARFVREMDFGRILFYVRSGLEPITRSNGGILQAASTIRHRKTVPLFTTYKITTRLIYWDENGFYLEQKFISLRDGFVRAIVMSQQKPINCTADEVMSKVSPVNTITRPEPPEELVSWLNSIKVSSEKLRKVD